MPNVAAMRLPFSPVTLLASIAVALAVTYIGLIAFVMSYAALTVGFSQSVRNDEAAVAGLEATYLARIQALTDTDYVALGYQKPVAQIFVPGTPGTALR